MFTMAWKGTTNVARRCRFGNVIGLFKVQDQAAAKPTSSILSHQKVIGVIDDLLPSISLPQSKKFHHSANRYQPLKQQTSVLPAGLHLNYLSGIHNIGLKHYYSAQSPKQEFGKDEIKSETGESADGNLKKSEEQDKPLTILQKFHQAYKEYGKVLIAVHVATSAVWFGGFFYAAYSGIDVTPILENLGVSEKIIHFYQKPGVGNAAVAYLLYKIATPARYTVTIGGTHQTVKWMRKIGYMEPVPEGSSIRELVKDSREQMKDRIDDMTDDLKDKVKDKMDSVKDRVDEMKDKRDDLKDRVKGRVKDRLSGKKKNE